MPLPGTARVSRTLLAALLCLLAATLHAQADPNPNDLLQTAIDKLTHASTTRFTYLMSIRTQNFNEKGKRLLDITQLFEVTWIGDLQFNRLLETDGKPLAGRALDQEQKRYDQAVKEHAALNDGVRAKIQHMAMKDAGIQLGLLPTRYTNTIAGHESCKAQDAPATDETAAAHDCLLTDSTPMPGAPQKHYRLQIDPTEHQVLRMDFDQLADEGDLLKGSTGSRAWTYIDGTPLLTASHLDGAVLHGNDRIHLIVDRTYSKYRKFFTTSRILPGDPADPQ